MKNDIETSKRRNRNMKKCVFIQQITITVSAILIAFSGGVQATASDGDAVASGGTVACSGNFRESSGTSSRWTIHNLNDGVSITLDRMRVYTAGGTNVYDSMIDGPATSATVVPFGDIGPYQTLSFKSEDLITGGFLPAELPGNERPVKVIFDWSSTNGKRVLTPYVLLTRRSISGNGETRHARDCRSID
jgi:hypothetical protein